MNIINKFYIFTFIVVSSLISSTPLQNTTILQNGRLFFIDKNRLFSYNELTKCFRSIYNGHISDIIIDAHILYCATPNGISYSDNRSINWNMITAHEGLPYNVVTSLESDSRFIYAGTERGLARMDKVSRQWESIGPDHILICDLLIMGNCLWVATSNDIYNINLKTGICKKSIIPLTTNNRDISHLFSFNNEVWALSKNLFMRYDQNYKQWHIDPFKRDINNIIVQAFFIKENKLWCATDNGIYKFTSEKKVWEHISFNSNVNIETIMDITFTDRLWVATSNGIYSFNESKQRWKHYAVTDKLSHIMVNHLFSACSNLIALSQNNYAMFDALNDKFYPLTISHKYLKPHKKVIPFNDYRGTGLQLSDYTHIGIQGHTSIWIKQNADFPEPYYQSISDYINGYELDSFIADTKTLSVQEKVSIDTISKYNDYLGIFTETDININANLNNGRNIKGYINNTNPLNPINYSATYFGGFEDKLREVGFSCEEHIRFLHKSIITPSHISGMTFRNEFGDRVGNRRQKIVSTALYGGRNKIEFFALILPFDEDNFYSLNISNIISETTKLYIDGILMSPLVYTLQSTTGILTFNQDWLINPESTIEIRGEYIPNPWRYNSDIVSGEITTAFSDVLSLTIFGQQNRIENDMVSYLDTIRVATGGIYADLNISPFDSIFNINAEPQILFNYSDSMKEHATGVAFDINTETIIKNVSITADLFAKSNNFRSVGQTISGHGELERDSRLDINWAMSNDIDLLLGYNSVKGSNGKESNLYLNWLISKQNLPSVKLRVLHNKKSLPYITQSEQYRPDSLKHGRINIGVKSSWNLPARVSNHSSIHDICATISYDFNSINDTLKPFDELADTSLSRIIAKRKNHNLYGFINFQPVNGISIQTKQLGRIFNGAKDSSVSIMRDRIFYRPELMVYFDELLLGTQLFCKYSFELNHVMFREEEFVDKSEENEHSFSSNILVKPGSWINAFYFLKLAGGISVTSKDSALFIQDKQLGKTSFNSVSYIINPIIDPSENIHLSAKGGYCIKHDFNSITNEDKYINTNLELVSTSHKKKIVAEYNYFKLRFRRYDSLATKLMCKNKHNTKIKGIINWNSVIRTELPIMFSWDKIDTTNNANYINSIIPGVVFNAQKECHAKFAYGFRWYTALSFYDGRLFNSIPYKQSIVNAVDFSLRITKNFLFRINCDVNYLINDKIILYNLVGAKVSILF